MIFQIIMYHSIVTSLSASHLYYISDTMGIFGAVKKKTIGGWRWVKFYKNFNKSISFQNNLMKPILTFFLKFLHLDIRIINFGLLLIQKIMATFLIKALVKKSVIVNVCPHCLLWPHFEGHSL